MAKDEDVSVGVSATGAAHVPHAKYDRLIARAKELPPVTTIIAHPCDETSLRGAIEAAEADIMSRSWWGQPPRSPPPLRRMGSTSAVSMLSTRRTVMPRRKTRCASFGKGKASS